MAVARSLADGPFQGHHGRRVWPGIGVHLYRSQDFCGHHVPASGLHRLIVVQKGRGKLALRDEAALHDALLVAGSVIFLPAGTACTWSGALPECIALSLQPERSPEAAAAAGEGERLEIACGRDAFVEHAASLLAADIPQPVHAADGALWTSVRRAIEAHLRRRYASVVRDEPKVVGLVGVKLMRVLDFVEAHLGDTITLDQMAAVAALGRFHFARMFKRALGVTPMAYVERARIERAKALLRDRELPLAEIGARVGFADQSHFTRRFRRHTGLTPAAFARGQASIGSGRAPRPPAHTPEAGRGI